MCCQYALTSQSFAQKYIVQWKLSIINYFLFNVILLIISHLRWFHAMFKFLFISQIILHMQMMYALQYVVFCAKTSCPAVLMYEYANKFIHHINIARIFLPIVFFLVFHIYLVLCKYMPPQSSVKKTYCPVVKQKTNKQSFVHADFLRKKFRHADCCIFFAYILRGTRQQKQQARNKDMQVNRTSNQKTNTPQTHTLQ